MIFHVKSKSNPRQKNNKNAREQGVIFPPSTFTKHVILFKAYINFKFVLKSFPKHNHKFVLLSAGIFHLTRSEWTVQELFKESQEPVSLSACTV